MPSFFEQLKTRNVLQWALAYVAGAAVVLELMDWVADPWNLPSALIRTVQVLVVVGFLVTLVLAWYHGEHGSQRVSGLELLLLAGLLATASLVIATVSGPGSERARASEPGSGGEGAVTSRIVVVGVLPVEVDSPTLRSEAWSGRIQRLLSGEMARPRGLAVMDELSQRTLLEESGSDRDAPPFRRLSEAGVSYVVRTTVMSAPTGVEVAHHLAETRTGHVLFNESYTDTNGEDLARQVRRAAMRLIDFLEGATGGVTKARDIEPWLYGDHDAEAVRAFIQGTEYAYRRIRGGGAYYERALEIDPDFIAPRIWLISGLVAEGMTEHAREHVRVLRELESGATPFERAMIGWADALTLWDLERMEGHLEVALGYSPGNNTLLYNLGFVRREMGRAEEALEPLRRSVETRWPYPDLYTLWGLTAVEAHRIDDLLPTLEGALAFGPHSATMYGLLEALALFEGDEASAARYGETFGERLVASGGEAGSEAVVGSASDVVEAYRSLAGLARGRGESERAASLLRRALGLDPANLSLRIELARILAERGDTTAAARQYARVVPAGSSDPEIVYLMGEVARLLDREDDALRHFSRYLELDPDGPHASRAAAQHRTLTGSR